jgi:signal transduction histidine kinase
MPSPSKILVDI